MFETIYLSMDANFKLKQKERGFSDPPLSNGYAYMVSNEKLLEHLAHCGGDKILKADVSPRLLMLCLLFSDDSIHQAPTCGSSFHAINDAHTKYSAGYAVTGVGGVDCARHGFKRPVGVVDLQKGERYVPSLCQGNHYLCPVSYANMDLALISTLLLIIGSGLSRILLSYDIACQWAKFFQRRLSLYPMFSSFLLSSLSYWRVVVPKFHLAGHGKDCQLNFNINYTKGAGRMTGEMIESGWAQSNSVAIWTRESGPFARRAVLDDHWGSENWSKLRRLREWIIYFDRDRLCSLPPSGFSLLKNLQKALVWSKTQRAVANNASSRLPPETLAEWNKMRRDFDRDPKSPNPYQEPEACKLPGLFVSFPH